MSGSEPNELAQRIAVALEAATGMARAQCEEAAFHLTDWRDDLEALHALYNQPGEYDPGALYEIVQAFLIHAPPHTMRASEILLGWEPENIFRDDDEESNEA